MVATMIRNRMHIHPVSVSFAMLALALSALLAGCDDSSRTAADFSPIPASTSAPVAGHIGDRPTELSLRERRLPLTSVRECNLERVNGKIFTGTPVTVERSASVVLSGWVVDAARTTVPADLAVRLVGMSDNRAWKVSAHTGGRREDVRKLLGGNAAYANAGFAATLDPSALPPGTYRAYVVFDGGSGTRSCDNGRGITIQ